MQGKGLLGLVSGLGQSASCRVEVTFVNPDTNEPVPTIKLKAQGKNAAEELPLYYITETTKICGEVWGAASRAALLRPVCQL